MGFKIIVHAVLYLNFHHVSGYIWLFPPLIMSKRWFVLLNWSSLNKVVWNQATSNRLFCLNLVYILLAWSSLVLCILYHHQDKWRCHVLYIFRLAAVEALPAQLWHKTSFSICWLQHYSHKPQAMTRKLGVG